MILNNREAIERLNSQHNLVNRLHPADRDRRSAMGLFGVASASRIEKAAEKIEPIEQSDVITTFNNKDLDTPILSSQSPPASQASPAVYTPLQPSALSLSERLSAAVQPSSFPKQIRNEEVKSGLDDLLEDNDQNIKLSLAHNKALKLLNTALETLECKLESVIPSKLPSVIQALAKTVNDIRREKLEASKTNKEREVHYHFYTPEQRKITDYKIIDVEASSAD